MAKRGGTETENENSKRGIGHYIKKTDVIKVCVAAQRVEVSIDSANVREGTAREWTAKRKKQTTRETSRERSPEGPLGLQNEQTHVQGIYLPTD